MKYIANILTDEPFSGDSLYNVVRDRNALADGHFPSNPDTSADMDILIRIQPVPVFIQDAMPVRRGDVDGIGEKAMVFNDDAGPVVHEQAHPTVRISVHLDMILQLNPAFLAIETKVDPSKRTPVADDENAVYLGSDTTMTDPGILSDRAMDMIEPALGAEHRRPIP